MTVFHRADQGFGDKQSGTEFDHLCPPPSPPQNVNNAKAGCGTRLTMVIGLSAALWLALSGFVYWLGETLMVLP